MVQQTAKRVNWNDDVEAKGPKCACGQRDYCDYSCMRDNGRATHNAVAVAHGLGCNPARMEARRNARSIAAVWESAVKYFGRTPEQIAEIEAEDERKAIAAAEHDRLVMAELEAGKAAYLAGIAFDDSLLTKLGRLGWKDAERDYTNGYRFFGSGMEVSTANRALRAGWEAARTHAAVAGMVTL